MIMVVMIMVVMMVVMMVVVIVCADCGQGGDKTCLIILPSTSFIFNGVCFFGGTKTIKFKLGFNETKEPKTKSCSLLVCCVRIISTYYPVVSIMFT